MTPFSFGRTRFVFALIVVFGLGSALSGCSSCTDVIPPVTDQDDGGLSIDRDACADDLCPPLGLCALQYQCEASCCAPGELCIEGACHSPGDSCRHSSHCPLGQVCEATLERCIPEAGECIYKPDLDIFDPVVLTAWRADSSTPEPAYMQVMMTPAVVDITENGNPDIVFSSFRDSVYYRDGILRAVDGRTFEPVFDLIDVERRVHPGSSLAIGDIDGDGRNEIVAVQPSGYGLIVFDDHTTDWAIKWRTEPFRMQEDGAVLVDLDGDGRVEVVAANRVFDGQTGELLCENSAVGNAPFQSVAVDLSGDGRLEVLAGNGAFRFESDGQGGFRCPTYWLHEHGGGFPAVGDFGTFTSGRRDFDTRDGIPEVVTVSLDASRQIQLVNGQSGKRIWAASIPTAGHPLFSRTLCESKTGAGPPTVADFNGDGRANIATAGACFYAVFDTDGSLMWKMPTQDFSSRNTGSSVFDFQGDGKAEVIYGDECFLRVFDGSGNGDGTTDILFEVANTTGTLRELPVIVDVDNDFHADIVVTSNDYSNGATGLCHHTWPNFQERGGASRGVRVIRDRHNRWVSTRPVWNQHAYHVTNVCDGRVDALCPGRENKPGAIPTRPVANHSLTHLNNFRQNVQGEADLFHAPDLTILGIVSRCGELGLEIEVVVANQGARGVPPGLAVALYASIRGNEELVTVLETSKSLAPGARETLRFAWNDSPLVRGDGTIVTLRAHADLDENEEQQHGECNEDNNTMSIAATCPCRSDHDCTPGNWCTERAQCHRVPQ
ncbi:MAG: hypothetical protein H0U74_17500 [Bradymonadaceae bacterium]|nr:hypothetical protein [Lujinxingiaceae bacterium]